jgi:uncharacterized protein with WD repeat
VPVTSCTKNLVNVADCKIYSQKFGDYLGVKVDRFSNSEKGSSLKDQDVKFLGMLNNFEIFHMREKIIAFLRLNVLSIIE